MTKRKQVTVNLDVEDYEVLDKLRRETAFSLSAWIRQAVKAGLKAGIRLSAFDKEAVERR